MGLSYANKQKCSGSPSRGTAFECELHRDPYKAACLAVQVQQLTDQETFVEHCIGHPANETLGLEAIPPRQLCFLAFLPHILDSSAAGRNAYLKVCLALMMWHAHLTEVLSSVQGLPATR